jgi:hypothetical protein
MYSGEYTGQAEVTTVKTHTKKIMIIEHIGIEGSRHVVVPKYHTLEQTWPRSSVAWQSIVAMTANFSACPVWIYTQSNIKNTMI